MQALPVTREQVHACLHTLHDASNDAVLAELFTEQEADIWLARTIPEDASFVLGVKVMLVRRTCHRVTAS